MFGWLRRRREFEQRVEAEIAAQQLERKRRGIGHQRGVPGALRHLRDVARDLRLVFHDE